MIKLDIGDSKVSVEALAWLKEVEEKLSIAMSKEFIASMTTFQKECVYKMLKDDLNKPDDEIKKA